MKDFALGFNKENEDRDNHNTKHSLRFGSHQDEINFYLSLSPSKEEYWEKMTQFEAPEQFNFGEEGQSSSKKSSVRVALKSLFKEIYKLFITILKLFCLY